MFTSDFQRKGIPAWGFVRAVGFIGTSPPHLSFSSGEGTCLIPCRRFDDGTKDIPGWGRWPLLAFPASSPTH